jgi:glycosyltransferase involved in cell wall biosynthesis
MNKISIVTPTFNEEKNIEPLCNEIKKQMNNIGLDYEHIIIDNASTDNTESILRKLSEKDKKIKVILNRKNFGPIRSHVHGIFQSTGDACIYMSADFQDPPDLIPKYIEQWKKGFKIVLAKKNSSQETFLMKNVRSFFYKLINKISEIDLTQNTTGAGLFDKDVINDLKKLEDPYPYFRGLLLELGYKYITINFEQAKREHGKTSTSFLSLYDYAINGIIKHSKLPLRIFTLLGFILSSVSILTAIVFFVYKILFWDSFELGIAPVIIGIFGFGGFQMFLLGLVGEYILSIFTHTRKIPLVYEKERINF